MLGIKLSGQDRCVRSGGRKTSRKQTKFEKNASSELHSWAAFSELTTSIQDQTSIIVSKDAYLNAAQENVAETFDVLSPERVFEVRKQRHEDLDVAGQQNLGVQHNLRGVGDVVAFLKWEAISD